VDDVGGRSGLEVWMSVGGRGWILCVAAGPASRCRGVGWGRGGACQDDCMRPVSRLPVSDLP